MKIFRNFISLLFVLALIPALAIAENNPSAYVTFAEGTTPSIISKSGKALRLGSSSTDGVLLIVNGSSVATITAAGINTAAGFGVNSAPFVPTMVATPVAGTNYFAPGLNVIPTAAASTAAFLGSAVTPIAGQQFRIINNSGAAVRIKAAGGATLNGATAGGYITIAALATVDCANMSGANQVCLQPVIPTPAGP